jgi:phage gp16-like protein
MSKIKKQKPHRNNQLAMIHIARAQLGLDDETYRSIVRLVSNGRESSAGQLDYAERKKLLEHFEARGWKNIKTATPTAAKRTNQPLVNKVGALLADMKLPWSYADGIAKRMYNRDRVQWCEAEELRGVIAALVKRQEQA